MEILTLSKIRSDLRYNPFSSRREKVLNAYLINNADKSGQVVVAVVVPSKPKLRSVTLSERYHAKFTSDSQKPKINDQHIDYQFFYPGESLPECTPVSSH